MSPHTYYRLGLCHVGVGVCDAMGGGSAMGVLRDNDVSYACMLKSHVNYIQ